MLTDVTEELQMEFDGMAQKARLSACNYPLQETNPSMPGVAPECWRTTLAFKTVSFIHRSNSSGRQEAQLNLPRNDRRLGTPKLVGETEQRYELPRPHPQGSMTPSCLDFTCFLLQVSHNITHCILTPG